MEKGEGSAAELKWLIEERRRRLEDVEEQMAATTDKDILEGLKGMQRMLSLEIADLEEELADNDGGDDFDEIIDDLDRKIRDINTLLENETDPIIRNNLEVSKRYLQMERNGTLIKITQTRKVKDPVQEKIEELEQLCGSRLRIINDLQEKLRKAEKDLSYYKAIAENPDRKVSCDTARVSVTAEALSELRNEAKVLSVNNYNLKTENRELKKQIDLLRQNVVELTKHCKEADSQVNTLQSRIHQLRKEMEARE